AVRPFSGVLLAVDSFPPRRSSDLYSDAGSTGALVEPLAPGDQFRLTALVPAEPPAGSVAGLEPLGAPVSELAELPDGVQSTLDRSEEHTSELQSRENLVCRLLLEK